MGSILQENAHCSIYLLIIEAVKVYLGYTFRAMPHDFTDKGC